MTRLLYWFPIVLSAIGVGIHFFGTLAMFQLEVPRVNHAVMLIIDFMVVVGLLRRTPWGYWLAILLYIEQSIMQPYWAYIAYVEGHGLFQLLVTSPLVITALLVLALNKALFIKRN